MVFLNKKNVPKGNKSAGQFLKNSMLKRNKGQFKLLTLKQIKNDEKYKKQEVYLKYRIRQLQEPLKSLNRDLIKRHKEQVKNSANAMKT